MSAGPPSASTTPAPRVGASVARAPRPRSTSSGPRSTTSATRSRAARRSAGGAGHGEDERRLGRLGEERGWPGSRSSDRVTSGDAGVRRLAPGRALGPAVRRRCGAARSPRPGRCRRPPGSRRPRPAGRENTALSAGPPSPPDTPVDRGGAVDAGHHVHQHPRPVRRARADRRAVGPAGSIVGRVRAAAGARRRTVAAALAAWTPCRDTERTAFRTCPLCEATCGLEITVADGEVTPHPRRPRRRVQPRLHLPEGLDAEPAPRGPRPAPRAAGAPRRRAGARSSWDEAFAEVERLLLPIIERARPRRRRRLPGQPQRPQPRRRCSTCEPLLQGPRHRATCSRPAPSTSAPRSCPSAWLFGGALTVARARPRPHRLPADARAPTPTRPTAAWPPRPTGPAASRPSGPGAAGWSWSTPGAAAPPRRPTGTSPSAPAPTPSCSRPSSPRLAADGPVDPGAGGRTWSGASTTWWRALAPFTPEAVADDGRRSTPPTIRAAGPRAGRAPRPPRSTAGSAPPPPSSARWPAGWSTWSTSSPATSTGPAAPCSPGPRPASPNTRGAPRYGRGAAGSAATTAGCGACPRPSASCRSPAWPRRSTPRARARSGPWSPWPATRCCRRPNSGRLDAALAALECYVAVDIYVNETTRHADVILPPPSALQKGHYDLALLQLAIRNVAN